jgi:hypothetical protein
MAMKMAIMKIMWKMSVNEINEIMIMKMKRK